MRRLSILALLALPLRAPSQLQIPSPNRRGRDSQPPSSPRPPTQIGSWLEALTITAGLGACSIAREANWSRPAPMGTGGSYADLRVQVSSRVPLRAALRDRKSTRLNSSHLG